MGTLSPLRTRDAICWQRFIVFMVSSNSLSSGLPWFACCSPSCNFWYRSSICAKAFLDSSTRSCICCCKLSFVSVFCVLDSVLDSVFVSVLVCSICILCKPSMFPICLIFISKHFPSTYFDML